MCGIAGLWRLGDRARATAPEALVEDGRALHAMLRAIVHRGPDDEGVFEGGRASVGVRRLSILDLAGGHQPLAGEGDGVWAGNNGELYNFASVRAELLARGHVFRTRTDTEILPHLYEDDGVDFVRRVEGMFGLFVVDTRADRLVLARDRYGVKPLYYVTDGERLRFASELRALLADPRVPARVAPSRFRDYLALGWVPGEDTVLEGVRRLPPGHRLVADAGGIRVEAYDDPSRPAPDIPADPRERRDELERRIAISVERQLASDVPLGILLSGGIDSSLLTALLPPEVRREALTFCVGFRDGGGHDERATARRVAEHLGTRHIEHEIDLDVEHWLTRVVEHLDEPLADPAAVPALAIADAASAHVKVLLSGTGGDELFGGYRRHRLGSLLGRLRWLPKPIARSAAGAIGRSAGSRRVRAGELAVFAGKALSARAAPNFATAYLASQAPARIGAWRGLLAEDGPEPIAALVARLAPTWDGASGDAAAALAFDRRYYLPDDLLLKEDRMTMAVSVEGRVPFLDETVAPYADALPMAERASGKGKRILRDLALRHLPPDIVHRPKHGFSVPVTEWLRGPLAAFSRARLLEGGASGVWRRDALARRLSEHASGRRDHGGVLWAALLWELWWASPSGPGGRPQGFR